MRKTTVQINRRQNTLPLTASKKEEILNYYITKKNNTATILATHFDTTEHQIHRIVDSYFKSLKTQSDEPPTTKKQT